MWAKKKTWIAPSLFNIYQKLSSSQSSSCLVCRPANLQSLFLPPANLRPERDTHVKGDRAGFFAYVCLICARRSEYPSNPLSLATSPARFEMNNRTASSNPNSVILQESPIFKDEILYILK
jgi:hypothetical protein